MAMKCFIFSFFLLLLLGTFQYTLSYDNGIASTPPKGWTTWCTDDLCGLRDICTEREVEKRVEAMVNNGNYTYKNKSMIVVFYIYMCKQYK